jgi:Na+/melibiose symporter-like transporter
LAQFRINIFNVVAAICSLLLVAYAWLMFLPMFEGSNEYSGVQTIVIWLSVLLVALSGLQFYFGIRRKETRPEAQASNSEEK